MRRISILIAVPLLLATPAGLGHLAAQRSPRAAISGITIDYPIEGSIFPPEITPPTFLWRDPAPDAAVWRIKVAFAGASAPIEVISRGEPLRIGEIDPRCISKTNEPPRLTEQQKAAHTWTPALKTWDAIKRLSSGQTATITITGFRSENSAEAVSSGRVAIQTSKDPVGAPIFYRDVPLMPSELEKGVIKPLAAGALPLVAWRLRDVGEPRSKVLMEGLHTCANCHSFSRRQDPGHGYGRPPQRQGDVRHRASRAPDRHPK